MENCIHGQNKQRNWKMWHTSCSDQILLYHLTLKYAERIQNWNRGRVSVKLRYSKKYICSLILDYTQTKNNICICEFMKTFQSPSKTEVKSLSCFQGNQPRYGINQHVVWIKYLLKHTGTSFRWIIAWSMVYKHK